MRSILSRERRNGVERITAGRHVFGVAPVTSHFYRVGSVLVDAGPPNQAEAVLEDWDAPPITHVLLTHGHEDHVGLAAAMAEQGAQVHAPAFVHDVLSDPPRLPAYRHRSWGQPEPVEARALGEAVQTPEGRFEVVPTPGHSPSHVCLHHAEQGWLFTGDAVLGPREELRFDEDLAGELASVQRLEGLDAEILFPGHGSILTDVSGQLADNRAWFTQAARRARELRSRGRSIDAIRRRLFGLEGFMRWFTGGEFSKTNLVRELLRLPPEHVEITTGHPDSSSVRG